MPRPAALPPATAHRCRHCYSALFCPLTPWHPAAPTRPCAANERTFLAWLGMATTLGTVSTAIAGFAVEDAEAKHKGGISQSTVELITLTLLPISIAMIAYALFTFYWRSEFIRRKQVGFFDDKVRDVKREQGLDLSRQQSVECPKNGCPSALSARWQGGLNPPPRLHTPHLPPRSWAPSLWPSS